MRSINLIGAVFIALLFSAGVTFAQSGQGTQAEGQSTKAEGQEAKKEPAAQEEPKKEPAAQEEAKKEPAAEGEKKPADTTGSTGEKVSQDAIKKLVGVDVYGNDGKKFGTVNKVLTADDGALKSVHVASGGYFGFFQSVVVANADQFELGEAKISLKMSVEEAKKLPKPE